MELNKIIRRSGITSSAIYSKFIADLTDALKDVTGITKEEVKENKDADGTLKEILSRYKQEKLHQDRQ